MNGKSGNGGKTLEISDNYGTADKKSAGKASGKPQNSAEILELCESEKTLYDFIEEAYEGANFSTAELELDYEYTSQDEIAALLKNLARRGGLDARGLPMLYGTGLPAADKRKIK